MSMTLRQRIEQALQITRDDHDGDDVLARVRAVLADTTGSDYLLVGDMPDSIAPECEHCTGGHGTVAQLGGRLLVHVWADGTGEVAWRESDDSRIGWGVPSPLVVAP